MKKVITSLAVLLASFSLAGLSGTATAHAASQPSKSATLTKGYRGTWYVYDGSFKEAGSPRLYSVEKLQFASHHLKVTQYLSKNSALTGRTERLSASFQMRYQKQSGGYVMWTNKQKVGTLKRAKAKVHGKSMTALKVTMQGTKLTAFRRAVASHAVGFYQLS